MYEVCVQAITIIVLRADFFTILIYFYFSLSSLNFRNIASGVDIQPNIRVTHIL